MKRQLLNVSAATLAAALVLTIMVAPVSAGVSAGAAAQLYVDNDGRYGPGCGGTNRSSFKTIQGAVNAVTLDNTIINVCPGTYRGRVVIDDENGLIIRAVDPWTATLRPAASHLMGDALILISEVRRTKIVGLNIVLPTVEPCVRLDAVIVVQNARHTRLRANHIRGLGADTLGDCGYAQGIVMGDSPGSQIAWNRLIDFQSRGISINLSSGVRVRGNTVRFNHADEGVTDEGIPAGILLFSSPQSRVRGNVVGSPTTAGDTTPILAGAIALRASSGTHVINNRVFHVQHGIGAETSSNLTISGNRVRHAQGEGIGLQGVSDSTVEDNSAKAGDNIGIDFGVSTSGNEIDGNDLRNNGGIDCLDSSVGPANTWTNNLGNDSSPPGICSSPT